MSEDTQAKPAEPWRVALEQIRERVSLAKSNAAGQLLAAAETIRQKASESDDNDAVRQAEQLAGSMEKTALYLESHTLAEIGEDVTAAASQSPWHVVGLAFIVGLVTGLLIRRR
jgi:ElaB/YqjD/DUF883 family membrane-anchored ribosome-binding protein